MWQCELWGRERLGGSSPRSLRSRGSERGAEWAQLGGEGPTIKMQTGSGSGGYIISLCDADSEENEVDEEIARAERIRLLDDI